MKGKSIMEFQIKWGKEPNTGDRITDIKGVIEDIELLSDPTAEESEWEEVFWTTHNPNDYIVEVLRMPVGDTFYLPYENNENKFEVLKITKLKN